MADGSDSRGNSGGRNREGSQGREWRIPRITIRALGSVLLGLGVVLIGVGAATGNVNTLIWIELGVLVFLGGGALLVDLLSRPRSKRPRRPGALQRAITFATALLALVGTVASLASFIVKSGGDPSGDGYRSVPCQPSEPAPEYGQPARKAVQ